MGHRTPGPLALLPIPVLLGQGPGRGEGLGIQPGGVGSVSKHLGGREMATPETQEENLLSGPAFYGVFFPWKQAARVGLKSKPDLTRRMGGWVAGS